MSLQSEFLGLVKFCSSIPFSRIKGHGSCLTPVGHDLFPLGFNLPHVQDMYHEYMVLSETYLRASLEQGLAGMLPVVSACLCIISSEASGALPLRVALWPGQRRRIEFCAQRFGASPVCVWIHERSPVAQYPVVYNTGSSSAEARNVYEKKDLASAAI